MKAQRMPPRHLLERRAQARAQMTALHAEMAEAVHSMTPGRIGELADRMEALAVELEQITRDMVEAVSATHH